MWPPAFEDTVVERVACRSEAVEIWRASDLLEGEHLALSLRSPLERAGAPKTLPTCRS
jgi:hypothetical protein